LYSLFLSYDGKTNLSWVLEFNKDVPEIEKHVQSFPLYIKSYTDAKYNLFKEAAGK